jgi:hypothetical protein
MARISLPREIRTSSLTLAWLDGDVKTAFFSVGYHLRNTLKSMQIKIYTTFPKKPYHFNEIGRFAT